MNTETMVRYCPKCEVFEKTEYNPSSGIAEYPCSLFVLIDYWERYEYINRHGIHTPDEIQEKLEAAGPEDWEV